MKELVIMSFFLIPALGWTAGITYREGKFDKDEDSSVSTKIIVDTNKKTGQSITSSFYGSHIDSYSPMPDKKLVKELELGKVRVGGNEFDVFNWKINKSVNSEGEIVDIPSLETLAKDIASYEVGGVFQMNLTGFMPEKGVDSYVIGRNFTAESAYEMIKYLNGTLKLKITDLSLGNEFSIWNETHPKIWPSTDGVSADEYIERYIQFAVAIRKAQEEVSGNANSIKLWGPEISTSWYDWNTSNFTKDCEWTDVRGQVACHYGNGEFTHFLPYFLKRLKTAEKDAQINPRGYKLLDYVAIHYYPNFRTKIEDPKSVIVNAEGKQLVAQMLESTQVLNNPAFINTIDISSYRNSAPNILGRMKGWLSEYYPEAKLAMNEFAVDSDYRSTTYHPIVRPLYLADSIGIFAKEGVAFLNQFLLSSNESSHLPWSMLENGQKKDLFYMYKLFTTHFKGTVVEASDNAGDVINSYATVTGEMINLAIINKGPAAKKVQVYVKNGATKKLITYTSPGWSSAVLTFDGNPGVFESKKFDINEFGAKEMGVPLDMSYAK